VVAIAMVFAVLAATAVAVYVQGVRTTAKTGGGDVSVLVAARDIPAGTSADEIVSAGAVETRSITRDQMVEGAVTDVADIDGQRTNSPILKGEQVSIARFDGGTAQLGGGTLGLAPGYQAVALNLDAARAAGGAVQPGDHVTIYATFSTNVADAGEVTVTLVQDAEVLATNGAGVGESAAPQILVTVALKPGKAQRLVFAQERGSVWLALLAPNESGADGGPVGYGEATQ
jgi:pilus assembly protein CpaB